MKKYLSNLVAVVLVVVAEMVIDFKIIRLFEKIDFFFNNCNLNRFLLLRRLMNDFFRLIRILILNSQIN